MESIESKNEPNSDTRLSIECPIDENISENITKDELMILDTDSTDPLSSSFSNSFVKSIATIIPSISSKEKIQTPRVKHKSETSALIDPSFDASEESDDECEEKAIGWKIGVENQEADDDIDEDEIFYPRHLTLLARSTSEPNSKDNKNLIQNVRRSFKMTYRSHDSIYMTLLNTTTQSAFIDTELPEGTSVDHYIIDIQARIVIKECKNDLNELISCIYYYKRGEVIAHWNIYPLPTEDGFNELNQLDFLFGQYSYYLNEKKLNQAEKDVEDAIPLLTAERNVNLVAKGLEGSGNLLRSTFKTTGKVTGDTIRTLGKLYTSAAVQSRKLFNKSASSDSVDNENILVAKKHKARCEAVHSGVISLTGAALYPVRWTGRKASEFASQGNNNIDTSQGPNSLDTRVITEKHTKSQSANEDATNSTSSSSSRVLQDTFGGLFNAGISSFKGFTEFVSEIGVSIGDAALHHAETIHGKEYAEAVTKHYVDAAGEIGLGMYKVINVAGFGPIGLALDVVAEGATFLLCLSDYLVGPIIIQGYMDMIQYPLLTPERYFVVLRPWSLSFYKHARDVKSRPFKMVITGMLDTMPKLRNYPKTNPSNIATSSVSNEFNEEKENDFEPNEETPMLPEEDRVPERDSIHEVRNEFLEKLRGGDRPHIEICTVDCSTFAIYPNEEQDVNDVDGSIITWFHYLREASFRVETVAKYKSGAEDIALEQRLMKIPKKSFLCANMKCAVIDIHHLGLRDEVNASLQKDIFVVNPLIKSTSIESFDSTILQESELFNFEERSSVDWYDFVFEDESSTAIRASVEKSEAMELQPLLPNDDITQNNTSNIIYAVPPMASALTKSLNLMHCSTLVSLRVRLAPLTSKGNFLVSMIYFI